MISFKTDEINHTDLARVIELSEFNEPSMPSHLSIHFSAQTILENYDLVQILEFLHSKSNNGIIYSLEQLGILSSFKGHIEKLEDDNIQRILFLTDINLLNEQKDLFDKNDLSDLMSIQYVALENLYYILKNSNICNSLPIFTKYDFYKSIVHQLPDLHVPLILSILFEFNPELANQITSEIDFLKSKLEYYHESHQIEIYSILQVFSLLFKYKAIPLEEASIVIQTINKYTWKASILDTIQLFYFEFFMKLDSEEYLRILSQTDFFKNSTKNFTILAILMPSKSNKDSEENNDIPEELKSYIERYNISDFYLSERGMEVKYHTESKRLFILRTMLKYIEGGFLENFIENCFPDIFNNFSHTTNVIFSYKQTMKHLKLIIKILSHVVQFSEECRMTLKSSDFNKMLEGISTYNEKSFILLYLSFFAPFELDTMEYLNEQFNIVQLCCDLIYGENTEGIFASINIFSMVLDMKNQFYEESAFIQDLSRALLNKETADAIEDISIEYSDKIIVAKAKKLLEYIHEMAENDE